MNIGCGFEIENMDAALSGSPTRTFRRAQPTLAQGKTGSLVRRLKGAPLRPKGGASRSSVCHSRR